MGETSLGTQPTPRLPEDHLDSWKEIAAYLKRDVTTVQRWEKREGMPVRRHLHGRLGSIYASAAELDAWLQGRKVRLQQEEEEEHSHALAVDAVAGPRPSGFPRLRAWLLLAAVALVGLLAATFAIRNHGAGSRIKSVAVLPLKNLSSDSSQEYLAEGITEAIIGRLSTIHDLRVISRTSVMRFKGTQLSVPEIAKTLGVDAIVEGSVIREGNRVRVNAQLIRGSTDDHLWSEAYDHELRDTLLLESEVAQSIARRVEVSVNGDERSRLVSARHVAPEVYESYLKGRFTKWNSRAEVEQSIGYYQDAISKDPTFAPAYVGMATSYNKLGGAFAGVPPNEVRPKVISAARKALELDPDLAEAHAVLAHVYVEQWKWSDAESEYKRALELNPNDSAAQLGLANWLMCQGRMEEALTWSQRARGLDPLGATGITTGAILFFSRRYDESIRELRSLLALHPDHAGAHYLLAFALIANHQAEEAIPLLEKTVRISDRSPGVVSLLVRAYAETGRRAEALSLLNELKRRQETRYVPTAAFVDAYLGLGDYEQTFAWLERAFQEQSGFLQWLKVHPYFDPLRGDPRFADLLRRIGLDQVR